MFIELPLKYILIKSDLSRQLCKWIVELGQFDITFLPRTTIKDQVLTNSDAEFSPQAVSPKQGCLASAHRERESSTRILDETELALEGAQGS